MDDEFIAPAQTLPIDLARALVDRARQAGPALTEAGHEMLSLDFCEDLDETAVIELLSASNQFFEKARSQLTRKLDFALSMVDRLEAEFATLRDDVRGLRSEREELLARLSQTESGLEAATEEFARQISSQAARVAARHESYLDGVSQIGNR